MPYVDDTGADVIQKAANSAASGAYYDALARGSDAKTALDQAKQAFDMAYQTAGLSGYFGAGVGNGTVAGQPTMPNIQWTSGAFGQYYPGGFNTISPGTPTQAAIENQQNYGLSQANATGVYYDPGNMTYRPGQFIYDPATGGVGQIQSNGRMQMFGDWGDFVRAGGSASMLAGGASGGPGDPTQDMVRRVSTQEYNALANDPGANFGGRPNGTATLELQKLYGTYGLPTQGQQTLANINQQNTIAQNWADRYGYTPQFDANGQPIGLSSAAAAGGAPGQGYPQTLNAQQQYWSQAFQEAQANQKNTQAYLGILANLRGPADWAKYQQVLGSTPQGLRDLYGAMMGQYTPGGGATTGMQPQAANLNTMQQQVYGYGGGYGQMPSYNYTTQPGAPQQPSQLAAQPQVWGSGIGVGQQGLTPDQAQQATGNGTNMWGANQPQYNLPAPNQIAPQTWNNLTPSQQQMALGMYEAGGYDKGDVEALYKQALPRYATNSPTAGTWRLTG